MIVRRAARVADLPGQAARRAYYRACRHLPLDEHLAIYSVYWGDGYRCNPRAIYEAARDLAPSVRGVWAVKADRLHEVPAGVEVVVEGSRAFLRALATAKLLVNNVNFPSYFRKRPGSVFVQTHHGTPLKRMGVEIEGIEPAERLALLERCRAWDFSLSSNRYSTDIWQRAYPVPFTSLEYGYPRNDVLVDPDGAARTRTRALLGLADEELAILYAPTHRDSSATFEQQLDLSRLMRDLGAGHRLLMRTHHFYAHDRVDGLGGSGIVDVSRHPRVEELFLAADVLVTDYSSVMFDFGVLDRPIVIFAPDWDEYRERRGTYFDLEAERPGPFARTYDELVSAISARSFDAPLERLARERFRSTYCSLDDGRASERVVRRVFLGETEEITSASRAEGGDGR